MKGYRPKEMVSCDTPVFILVPTFTNEGGKIIKSYPQTVTGLTPVFVSFKTFGGTEKENNGIIVIEDTADLTTWYNPAINADCLIQRASDNARFEILNEPENIDQAFMFMKFKVRRLKGGA